MIMKTFLQTLIVTGIFLMAGCQEVTPTASPLPKQETLPTETTVPRQIIPQTSIPNTSSNDSSADTANTTPDPNSQQVVQIAIADLAQKLQISADQISLSSMESVTWPDASLGCPKRGVAYIQALTPGFKLILGANGKSYPYHTDENETVVFCGLNSGAEQFLAPTP
jgi:hypothetical protein